MIRKWLIPFLSRLYRTPSSRILYPAEIIDLLKGFLIGLCVYVMSHIDTSMIYHIIKSQSVIKLYLFYNMLEVSRTTLSWVPWHFSIFWAKKWMGFLYWWRRHFLSYWPPFFKPAAIVLHQNISHCQCSSVGNFDNFLKGFLHDHFLMDLVISHR